MPCPTCKQSDVGLGIEKQLPHAKKFYCCWLCFSEPVPAHPAVIWWSIHYPVNRIQRSSAFFFSYLWQDFKVIDWMECRRSKYWGTCSWKWDVTQSCPFSIGLELMKQSSKLNRIDRCSWSRPPQVRKVNLCTTSAVLAKLTGTPDPMSTLKF